MKDKSGILTFFLVSFGLILVFGLIITGYEERKKEVEKQYLSEEKYQVTRRYKAKSTDPEPDITDPEPEVTEAPEIDNPLYALGGVIKSHDFVVACDRKDLNGITSGQLIDFVNNYSEYNVVFYFGNDIAMYIEDGFYFAEYGKYLLSSNIFYESYTKIDFKGDFVITNMETLEGQNIGPVFDSSCIMHTKAIK